MKYLLFILLFIPTLFSNVSAQKSIESHLLDHINHLRDSLGVSPLLPDQVLNEAAFDHAYYIADKSKLTHFQETFSKETPSERVTFYGGQRTYVGENIAQTTAVYASKNVLDDALVAEALFKSWFNSPKHYANMTDPKYTKLGFGHWIDKNKQVYGAHVFSSNEIKLPVEFKNPSFSWE